MKNEPTCFPISWSLMLRQRLPIRLLFVAVVLVFTSSTLPGQSDFLRFDNAALDEVMKAIEEKSDYVFNYDPDLLGGYYFSGRLATGKVEEALQKLLYDSPCGYELQGKTVLIYKPTPKTYRICGTVSGYGKEPLAGANVVAVQTSSGTQADEFGAFDFELTADKNQAVEISYLGYKPVSFLVQDLKQGDCPAYRLAIDADLWGEEIVIKDYLLDGITEGSQFGGLELNFDKLSKNHSTVEHDILKTAQLLPGINSIDDSATNLQIRGSNPGQNLILWEGTPVYNAGHIFGMISAINPFSVHAVSIFKGAHDPRYDNRVGGIIDISLTDSLSNDFTGSVGTTLTEVHTNLYVPFVDDRLSLVVSGRQNIREVYNSPPLQSYTDKVFQFSLIDDQAQSSNQESLNTEQGLSYSDWSAKLLYQATDRLRLNVGTYSNQQNFSYSFSFNEDPFMSRDEIVEDTKIINAGMELEMNKKWSGLISFYNSRYTNNYASKETENDVLLRENNQFNFVEDNSFTVSNNFRPSPKWTASAGYTYNTKRVRLDLGEEDIFNPERLPNQNEQAGFHNLFASLSYSGKKLRVDAGIRTTHYQEQAKSRYSPRLNLQYFINEKLNLKADGGVYHQFISQTSNFGSRQIGVDNPLWILNAPNDQLSQTAHKMAAGFVFRDRGWLVDIEAYYNRTLGLSTLTPLFNALSDTRGFSKGSATATGVDVLLKKKWSGFSTWVNYSFGITRNEFPDIEEQPFFSPNDIRHIVSIVNSCQVKKIQFSLSSNYHTGLPFTNPDLVLNETEEEVEDPFLYFLEYTRFNGRRLKPYLRFDLNVNYRFALKKGKKLKSEISLSMINLFNTNNIAAREYYLDYNEQGATYASAYIEKVLLGRTPLLLFRVYW